MNKRAKKYRKQLNEAITSLENCSSRRLRRIRKLLKVIWRDDDLSLEAKEELMDRGLIPIFRHDGGTARIPGDLHGSFAAAASFRQYIFQRIRKTQMCGNTFGAHLQGKDKLFQFIDRLGIPRPSTTENFPLAEVWNKLEEHRDFAPCVLKPQQGTSSKGVHLIYGDGTFLRVKDTAKLHSLDELQESLKQTAEDFPQLRDDDWYLEEMVIAQDEGLPPRDLKLFCFYGEVGAVMEVLRTTPPQYSWRDEHGKEIPGIIGDKLYEGDPISTEALEYAKRISASMPIPYVRVDFLKGRDAQGNEILRFGEMTAFPGSFETFYNETDQRLGDMCLQAEDRLMRDLFDGKAFEEFRSLMT